MTRELKSNEVKKIETAIAKLEAVKEILENAGYFHATEFEGHLDDAGKLDVIDAALDELYSLVEEGC